MSLLNDMLRDLNRHSRVQESVAEHEVPLLNGGRKSSAGIRFSAVVIFLLIFFNVLALRYAWHKWGGSSPDITSKVAAQGSRSQAAVITPSSQPAAFDKAQEADAAAPLIKAEKAARIEELFRQAERALSMDRLTSPVEDNAYSYYQKILELSPGNDAAQSGLVNIAARYLAKGQEQISLGNRAQADALINRARFVAPDYVNAQPNGGYGEMQAQVDGSLVSTSVAPVDTAAETAQITTANFPQTASATTEAVKTMQVTEAPSLAVKPNASWQDEQSARDARQLLGEGREAEAVNLLKHVLVTQNQPVASASLLADIYLQQGELSAADVLQNQLAYLPEVTRTKIKAQMAVAKGDQAGAITLLEQQLSDAQADENYRALLASLYHKTGAYAQSVTSYQRLIGSFGEKPAYWLGLALAYDGLAQPKNALQAYLHLRDFPQLQEQVKTYTDQRIAALRSQ